MSTMLSIYPKEDSPTLLAIDEDEKVVFNPQDMFEKNDEETLRGGILWLVPSAQKNEMEPILMSIGPGGSSQEIPPHEGEEFGYVLSGSVLLHNGEKKLKVKTGDSFCRAVNFFIALGKTGYRDVEAERIKDFFYRVYLTDTTIY